MRTPVFLLLISAAQAAYSEEPVDLAAVHRMRAEALQNSKVMDHLFYLADVHGPRLQGSPAYDAAAGWVIGKLKEYGIDNGRTETWPGFGKSWTCTRFSIHLVQPQYAPLIGFPQAWSSGTAGTVAGEPVLAALRTEGDFEKQRGKLRGQIVLLEAPRDYSLQTRGASRRYTDQELAEMAMASDPAPAGPQPDGPLAQFLKQLSPAGQPPSREQMRAFRNKLSQFLKDEGVVAVITPGYRGDRGTVFASSFGGREAEDPVPPPAIALTPEHYNRLCRLIDRKVPVKLEFEMKVEMGDKDVDGVNVLAEIPGGRKKDEVVMIGGHLDSWQGATGATDNATGCAVMIEVMRILKTLNLRLDRTVRLALWGAEEQGLIGSREYVKKHFADRETMKLLPEHARLSAYYNLDNGSGKIRGVYLQGNDMLRPVFEAWLEPFHDLGAGTVSIRNTTGTDHLSFDAVGLPGFQFIQDPLEYFSTTHHSNMDVYEQAQSADLMQASAIIASFVYHTANRAEMLPRKPLPKPQPRKEGAPAR